MSKQVKNAEIEDVLSSIRRLVSENSDSLRDVPRRIETPAAAPRPSLAVSDRLVLTPALRVAVAPSDIEVDTEVEPQTIPDQDDTVGMASGLQGFEVPFEMDGPSDLDGSPDQEWASENVDVSQDEIALDVSDTEVLSFAPHPDTEHLEGDAADQERSSQEDISYEDDANSNDEGDDDYNAADSPGVSPADHRDASLSDSDEARVEQRARAIRERFVEPEEYLAEREEVIQARILPWSASDAPKAEALYEPDVPGDSDYAGTDVDALVWEDHQSAENNSLDGFENPSQDDLAALAGRIEVDVQDYVQEGVVSAIAPELGEAERESPITDDALLDEDALREMVADIVRQELQGSLGERITRNVRKLVRREIHRALAAHDLD